MLIFIGTCGELVHGASYADWTLVEHVSVDHRGFDVLVPQQLLDCPDIVARFEQMGGE